MEFLGVNIGVSSIKYGRVSLGEETTINHFDVIDIPAYSSLSFPNFCFSGYTRWARFKGFSFSFISRMEDVSSHFTFSRRINRSMSDF
jgi:hypothetical protein